MVNPAEAHPLAYPVPAEGVPCLIDGRDVPADGGWMEKRSPHDGSLLWRYARGGEAEVRKAVEAAKRAQPAWAALPGPERGRVLHAFCDQLEAGKADLADIVARECAKSPKEAAGEVDAAIACGRFFAGEGQRSFGRTVPSGVPGRFAMTVRQPVGVAGLIIAANTPAANVAWKVFPALICGNGVVLKAAEDAPATAWWMGRAALRAGLPAGVFNVVQGLGPEAGAPLVSHPDVGVISFTGSADVGREIARVAGARLAKVSLELGGKNPFVVCDDADLDRAVDWAVRSAFSNAGQRCASGSRILVFDAVYDEFRDRMVEATRRLRLGPDDDCDLGPVISEKALSKLERAMETARSEGVTVLCGGGRSDRPEHHGGYYFLPTILEGVSTDSTLWRTELFGPVTVLRAVADLDEAIDLSDDSPYGLTACIHTSSFDRAWRYATQVASGVAVVNGGTFGSEPHMPFGGLKDSGNGTREPGPEAIDVYTEIKDVYLHVDLSVR
ncbi:MAG: aldehyde dehydrogenase [Acidimicrobiales bacterium]|nr:MAG: aldehyde dehydrogenase [Acidimicrobiales bacterium]